MTCGRHIWQSPPQLRTGRPKASTMFPRSDEAKKCLSVLKDGRAMLSYGRRLRDGGALG